MRSIPICLNPAVGLKHRTFESVNQQQIQTLTESQLSQFIPYYWSLCTALNMHYSIEVVIYRLNNVHGVVYKGTCVNIKEDGF